MLLFNHCSLWIILVSNISPVCKWFILTRITILCLLFYFLSLLLIQWMKKAGRSAKFPWLRVNSCQWTSNQLIPRTLIILEIPLLHTPNSPSYSQANRKNVWTRMDTTITICCRPFLYTASIKVFFGCRQCLIFMIMPLQNWMQTLTKPLLFIQTWEQQTFFAS